jgi:hypothetical protein
MPSKPLFSAPLVTPDQCGRAAGKSSVAADAIPWRHRLGRALYPASVTEIAAGMAILYLTGLLVSG